MDCFETISLGASLIFIQITPVRRQRLLNLHAKPLRMQRYYWGVMGFPQWLEERINIASGFLSVLRSKKHPRPRFKWRSSEAYAIVDGCRLPTKNLRGLRSLLVDLEIRNKNQNFAFRYRILTRRWLRLWYEAVIFFLSLYSKRTRIHWAERWILCS